MEQTAAPQSAPKSGSGMRVLLIVVAVIVVLVIGLIASCVVCGSDLAKMAMSATVDAGKAEIIAHPEWGIVDSATIEEMAVSVKQSLDTLDLTSPEFQTFATEMQKVFDDGTIDSTEVMAFLGALVAVDPSLADKLAAMRRGAETPADDIITADEGVPQTNEP